MQVQHHEAKSRFEIDLGDAVALAAYHLMPGKIAFTHTSVPPSHEGRGIGTMLIKAGLAFAREEGLMVIPTCPFFAAYMQRHADTHDLLDADQRRILRIA